MIENKGWMQWEVPFYGRWLEQRCKRMPILQRFGGTACQGERTNGSCKSVWHEWGVEEEKTFLYHARVFWAGLVMRLTKEIKKTMEKAMATHSSTLPRKSHGWRILVRCSPWGHEESDSTERLHFHFSLSCTGEGNGSPLQCSCLKNPRDGGAWWAAVYGVARSQTQLKQLSSSSNMSAHDGPFPKLQHTGNSCFTVPKIPDNICCLSFKVNSSTIFIIWKSS